MGENILKYRVVRQWWIIRKPLVSGFFIHKKNVEKKDYANKKFGNLLETASASFQ